MVERRVPEGWKIASTFLVPRDVPLSKIEKKKSRSRSFVFFFFKIKKKNVREQSHKSKTKKQNKCAKPRSVKMTSNSILCFVATAVLLAMFAFAPASRLVTPSPAAAAIPPTMEMASWTLSTFSTSSSSSTSKMPPARLVMSQGGALPTMMEVPLMHFQAKKKLRKNRKKTKTAKFF